MKSYSSREVIRILKDDGWYEVAVVGSITSSSIRPSRGASQSSTPPSPSRPRR